MDNRTDLVIASLFVMLGVFMVGTAVTFPPPVIRYDPLGPMGLPLGIGVFFIVGGGVQVARTASLWRRLGRLAPSEGSDDEPGHPSVPWRAPAFLVGGFVYIALITPLGYLIATILASSAALWSMHVRPAWKVLVSSVAFSAVVFFAFRDFLGIPLPLGPLSGMLP